MAPSPVYGELAADPQLADHDPNADHLQMAEPSAAADAAPRLFP
jgi:hypothetical protein